MAIIAVVVIVHAFRDPSQISTCANARFPPMKNFKIFSSKKHTIQKQATSTRGPTPPPAPSPTCSPWSATWRTYAGPCSHTRRYRLTTGRCKEKNKTIIFPQKIRFSCFFCVLTCKHPLLKRQNISVQFIYFEAGFLPVREKNTNFP